MEFETEADLVIIIVFIFKLDPTAPDPYETKLVEVCCSNIEGAKEGLFAKTDIEVNTTVAFYNGSRADPDDFDPSTWETNNYKIFDPANIPEGTIDIPPWAQVPYHIKIRIVRIISFYSHRP